MKPSSGQSAVTRARTFGRDCRSRGDGPWSGLPWGRGTPGPFAGLQARVRVHGTPPPSRAASGTSRLWRLGAPAPQHRLMCQGLPAFLGPGVPGLGPPDMPPVVPPTSPLATGRLSTMGSPGSLLSQATGHSSSIPTVGPVTNPPQSLRPGAGGRLPSSGGFLSDPDPTQSSTASVLPPEPSGAASGKPSLTSPGPVGAPSQTPPEWRVRQTAALRPSRWLGRHLGHECSLRVSRGGRGSPAPPL